MKKTNKNTNTHDLVARVIIDGGCSHDMSVNDFMGVFLRGGEEAVKSLLEDDQTYVYFLRLEEKGTCTML